MNDRRIYDDARSALMAVGLPPGKERFADRLFHLLSDDAISAGALKVKFEHPTPPPGVLAMMVPRTRFFINVTQFKQRRLELLLAVLLPILTSEPTGAIHSLPRLAENLRLLSDDEAEVVGVISRLTLEEGAAREEAIRDAYQGATVDIEVILGALFNKKVIERVEPDGTIRVVH